MNEEIKSEDFEKLLKVAEKGLMRLKCQEVHYKSGKPYSLVEAKVKLE